MCFTYQMLLGIQTKVCDPFQLPYLSPLVLRKEVESLILLEGPKFLEKEEFVREQPIIYWNLVWYFSRLQLPTYLPLLSLWDFQHKNQQLSKVSHSIRCSWLNRRSLFSCCFGGWGTGKHCLMCLPVMLLCVFISPHPYPLTPLPHIIPYSTL